MEEIQNKSAILLPTRLRLVTHSKRVIGLRLSPPEVVSAIFWRIVVIRIAPCIKDSGDIGRAQTVAFHIVKSRLFAPLEYTSGRYLVQLSYFSPSLGALVV
jgi:hypothetical protein